MSNPSKPEHDDNPTAEAESHFWQFRDIYLPDRMFDLAVRGEVTLSDILLAIVIHKLTTPQTSKKDGVGCYASNNYLGGKIRLHPRYVSDRLAHLAALGLLIVVRMKTKRGEIRYLEMEWSRTIDEARRLRGAYGEAYRKVRGVEEADDDGGDPPSGKPEPPLQENLNPPFRKTRTPPLQENLNRSNTAKVKNSDLEPKKPPCRPAAGGGGAAPPLGDVGGDPPGPNGLLGGKGPAPTWARDAARRLHDKVVEKRKDSPTAKPSSWPAHFIKLRDWYASREKCATSAAQDYVDDLLDWYIDHLGEARMPEAFCGRTFYEKFVQIESARDRRAPLHRPPGDDEPRSVTGQRFVDGTEWGNIPKQHFVDGDSWDEWDEDDPVYQRIKASEGQGEED